MCPSSAQFSHALKWTCYTHFESEFYGFHSHFGLKLLLESFTDDIDVIFLSGREDIGRCRQETTAWLENNLPYNITDDKLLLREKNDHRKDSIVKKELYEKYIKNKYNIICVFEDRNQCVDMWRDLGILCCQVYYGEF